MWSTRSSIPSSIRSSPWLRAPRRSTRSGNLLSTSVVRRGDVEAALAGAAHVVSRALHDLARSSTPSWSRRPAWRCRAALRRRLATARRPARSRPAVPPSSSSRRARAPGTTGARSRRCSALPEADVRVTQVPTGGAFGGKEDLSRPGADRAPGAGLRDSPCCSPCRAARASASTPSATRSSMDYEVGCDADGRLRRRPRADRRRHGRLRERRERRSSSGPPATPAAPTESRTWTSRRAPSTRTTRRRAPSAASASPRRPSPWTGCLDRLAEQVGHRRLGDPLAERGASRRPVRDGPGPGAGRRAREDAPRGARRVSRRPRRRDRVRCEERRRSATG